MNISVNELMEKSIYENKKKVVSRFMGKGLIGGNITLNKVVIPNNGDTEFKILYDANGEPEYATDIVGVIVHSQELNSYFKDGFTGESRKPDCYSLDGVKGIGTPGVMCRGCDYNKYGSDGRGKACRNKKKLSILRDEDLTPIELVVGTGSLKDFNSYDSRLLVNSGKLISEVKTKITVDQGIASNGMCYSKLAFAMDDELAVQDMRHIEEISEMINVFNEHKISEIEFDANI